MSGTPTSELPLCVDLDGTLVKTDTLMEGTLLLFRKSPLSVVRFPGWLLKGKAYFKHQIAERSGLDASLLPYHPEFLGFLREERDRGRTLVLATAASEKVAHKVSGHLKIFSDVLATKDGTNLKGRRKRLALEHRYGHKGFAYAGNARVDLEIWPSSGEAIVVNAPASLSRLVARVAPVSREFPGRRTMLHAIVRSIRLHQWVKNLLVFVPLLLAHKLQDMGLLKQAAVAFLTFGFCASSVYLVNDLLDVEPDRSHPRKRFRPFAAGDLPLSVGVVLAPLLLVFAFFLAYHVNASFLALLALYYAMTLAYSFFFKKVLFGDVILLAALYTIRIIAGAAAVTVPLSPWLLAFSLFLFLSLALVKRYSELFDVKRENRGKGALGREYLSDDLNLLSTMGVSSGYLSILVLALYMNSDEVRRLYSNPTLLWLVCPILLYWVSRIWLLTHRGQVPDDPILFAIRDKVSYVVGALVALVIVLGT